jgi:hypothetical protein
MTATESERGLIHKGDWFEGPGGTNWRVVDPWTPMETDGPLVPFVWIEGQDGGDRWIEVETFDAKIEDGDFISIDAPDVATDGGERPPECSCDELGITEVCCWDCYEAGYREQNPEVRG